MKTPFPLLSIITCITIITSIGAQSAVAAPPVVSEEEHNAVALPEIVVEARVKAHKPLGVDTLEVREVRERSLTDLGEALAEQGLASRVRRGPIGSDVVLRWFQRDNLSLSIDGALVHGACPNRMDPPSFHIDYSEVSRVEVRRGPFDVSLPGVLGGSVRVETRRPRPGFNAELNLSGGENRHLETSAAFGYGGRDTDVLGSYAYKHAWPYVTGDGTRVTALYPLTSPNRYRDTSASQTAYGIQTAWLQAGHSFLSGRDRLQVSYTLQDAASVLYPYLLMDGVSDQMHRVNASYRIKDAGPVRELNAQFFFSNVGHLMNDSRRCSASLMPGTCTGALGRGWSMETAADAVVVGARLLGSALAGEPLRFGVDFFRRGWSSTTTRLNRTSSQFVAQASLPNTSLLSAGLHASYARSLGEALRLSAGLRVDFTHGSASLDGLPAAEATMAQAIYRNAWGSGAALAATEVLPGGNVQLDARLSERLEFYVGIGHAARAPDPQERYFALSGSAAMGSSAAKPGRVGNPALRPPRNTELDLGLRFSAPWVLAKAQAFASQVADASVVAPLTGGDGVPSVTYRNVQAWLAGAELWARFTLPRHFFVEAALTYTHGWNATSGAPLQETPPLSGRLAVRWDNERFFVELEEQLAARQDRVDTSAGEQATPDYYVTNVRVGGSFGGVRLMAGVSNLFNRRYVQHLNYLRDPFASGVPVPEPGLLAYAALQYRY